MDAVTLMDKNDEELQRFNNHEAKGDERMECDEWMYELRQKEKEAREAAAVAAMLVNGGRQPSETTTTAAAAGASSGQLGQTTRAIDDIFFDSQNARQPETDMVSPGIVHKPSSGSTPGPGTGATMEAVLGHQLVPVCPPTPSTSTCTTREGSGTLKRSAESSNGHSNGNFTTGGADLTAGNHLGISREGGTTGGGSSSDPIWFTKRQGGAGLVGRVTGSDRATRVCRCAALVTFVVLVLAVVLPCALLLRKR